MDTPLNIEVLGEQNVYSKNSAYTLSNNIIDMLAQKNAHVYHNRSVLDLKLKKDSFSDNIHLNNVTARKDITDALVQDLAKILN